MAHRLYPTHIPTSPLQKLLLAGGSALMAIARPQRGDMVATMGETTAIRPVLQRLYDNMARDEGGQRLLLERPRITNTSVDRKYLRSLEEGTFGREYERFLSSLETSPDARPPVQFIDDADLVYVMQRYRETHDFTHVVLGMPTTMLGEVTVKWFEGIQFGLPMCVSGGVFGTLRLGPKHRQRFFSTYMPWVIKQGVNGRFFLSVEWEKHWETPLKQLRRQLNLDPPPTENS
uniref:Ubiquinone biosynthesis protein COQ4 homolog, mitochondrial n=1 Tax=Plectus sambesii TaxID=2011161 RepID=A0A914W996_9BILA